MQSRDKVKYRGIGVLSQVSLMSRIRHGQAPSWVESSPKKVVLTLAISRQILKTELNTEKNTQSNCDRH